MSTNMKKYKCHKEVHAEPITRGAYNVSRGWTIPDDEDPEDAGYKIVYNRGTVDAYISWSPKKQFDDGYDLVEGSTFESRLIIELEELRDKSDKLLSFFDTTIYANLQGSEQKLLVQQCQHMVRYGDILAIRIQCLTGIDEGRGLTDKKVVING